MTTEIVPTEKIQITITAESKKEAFEIIAYLAYVENSNFWDLATLATKISLR
jgi:hypothetical protein